MLAKRIIPCLDIKDGRTVKGVNFVDLKDAGDPVELGKKYCDEGADELVFLDITATHEKRKTLAALAKNIAQHLNIPFTIGGGISSVNDASYLLEAGADKISINSAAVKNPDLINQLADTFGNQFVVVAIDAKHGDGGQVLHQRNTALAWRLERSQQPGLFVEDRLRRFRRRWLDVRAGTDRQPATTPQDEEQKPNDRPL